MHLTASAAVCSAGAVGVALGAPSSSCPWPRSANGSGRGESPSWLRGLGRVVRSPTTWPPSEDPTRRLCRRQKALQRKAAIADPRSRPALTANWRRRDQKRPCPHPTGRPSATRAADARWSSFGLVRSAGVVRAIASIRWSPCVALSRCDRAPVRTEPDWGCGSRLSSPTVVGQRCADGGGRRPATRATIRRAGRWCKPVAAGEHE